MTPTPTPKTPQPKPRRRKPGRAVVIHGVPWEMYEKLRMILDGKRGMKLTYDREELEIMVPSLDHDFGDRVLGVLIQILAEELGVPIRPGGATTMKLRKKLKAIEGDEIFWLANAPAMAGVRDLDLKIHPPPDLAIEVDVSRSSMNRLAVYAKLGVPEVWRLDGDTLTFHVLVGKRYVDAMHSRSFLLVSPTDLIPFIQRARVAGDQTPIYRDFRAWVRQRAASPPAPPTL